MAENISVSNSTRVNSYRGIQTVYDNLTVEVGSRVILSGYPSTGETYQDFTRCLKIDAFIGNYKGFSNICEEILKIPFDSSCTIGVQLYDCLNKSINVNSVQSATITFQDAYQAPMVVNHNKNLLEYLISPKDYSMLAKGKVYDMIVKVVDENGNRSTVLSKKIRFN